jgi:aspartate aminotransferase-like enzyme
MWTRPPAISLVPGPTDLWPSVLDALSTEPHVSGLAAHHEMVSGLRRDLRLLFGTRNSVLMRTGEATLAGWSALRSLMDEDSCAIVASNGPEAERIADMARALTRDVNVIASPEGQPLDTALIALAVERLRPQIVAMVHCEVATGVLNPVGDIARHAKAAGVPIVLVDVHGTLGGVPVEMDAWGADLCVSGVDRCLSALPATALLALADTIRYPSAARPGAFDSLDEWRRLDEAAADRQGARTLHDRSLRAAIARVVDGGLETTFERHAETARYTRDRVRSLGLQLVCDDPASASPTVTCFHLPETVHAEDIDTDLRSRGVAIGRHARGGLADTLSIGHMGSQSDFSLVKQGLDAFAEALATQEIPA